MNEFSAQRQSGDFWKTSTKLSHWNGLGHSRGESACEFVISAVSVTNTTGARKSAAAAISRLWSAITSSRRRLRTAGGGIRRRRGVEAAPAPAAVVSSDRTLVVDPAAGVPDDHERDAECDG